jgi:hypothetical protein
MIDYFYMLHHRRLRERFGLAAVERHEACVMRALDKRRADQRTPKTSAGNQGQSNS